MAITNHREDSERTLTTHNNPSDEKAEDMSPANTSNDFNHSADPRQAELSSTKPIHPSHLTTLPRLPLNLLDYKVPLLITTFVLLLSTCAIPLIVYWVVKYHSTANPPIYLGVSTVGFGVSTLYNYFTRLYRLTLSKKNAFYRPLHSTSKWQLDFFHWDFALSFLVETAVIVISVALPPTIKHPFTGGVLPRMTSMAIVFLIGNLSLQMVLAHFIIGVRNPFPISSVPKGEPARPALYTIVEDVVAVDGNFGREWREAWDGRYRASPGGMMKKLLTRLGLIWGVAGCAFTALMAGIIFSPSVTSHDAAWTVGFTAPWGFIALMVLFTVLYCKRHLKQERAMASSGRV